MTGIDNALDQHLDLAAAFLLAEQAGADDSGVVEYQQVTGREQRRQVGEMQVGNPVAIDVQQPAAPTLGCGVLGDVSYFMPDSMGYTLHLYWRLTFWGRKGVLETSSTTDHIMVALNGETAPRYEPLPPGNPAGYLTAFLHDIANTSTAAELTTTAVLKAARQTLQIQQVADRADAGTRL